MNDPDGDPDVTELLADLTRSLQELQREMEPDRRLRPPTPGELSQFTSEVAIPGLILILQTNIKALQLLQRTLRLAQGREPTGSGSSVSGARERAEQLSRATLDQLDSTLSEVQSAVEGRPPDDDTRELLDEARSLRDRIQDEIEESETEQGDGTEEGASIDVDDGTQDPVDIDVEAELRTLRDNLEDDGDGEERPDKSGTGDNGGADGGEDGGNGSADSDGGRPGDGQSGDGSPSDGQTGDGQTNDGPADSDEA